jgi:Tol biopolymer transport system component
MPRRLWLALALAGLLLAACGEVPTAMPRGTSPATPPGPTSYPPPPTFPTIPPVTAGPEVTVVPTTTPAPTTVPVPVLEYQPVPAELRQGERIAFLRDGNLWLVRPDGSALAQVSTSGNVSAIFGWSWDNSRLLLGVTSQETGQQRAYPWLDLWALSADGSSAQQITQGQSVTFASWSPVDLSFAYVTLEGRPCVVNMEEGESRRLEDARAGFQESAWSPDGTRLAVRLPPPDSEPGEFALSTDIGIWNLRDGSVTNLTNTNDDPSRIMNYFPTWSVDGSRILFESPREPVSNYQFWYVMDSDGSNLRHLDTPPLLGAVSVVRSPVADQVVMNVGGEVWLLDFNGHMEKIANTTWPCCPYPPYSWSPDGRKLALVGAEGKLVRIDVNTLAVEIIAEVGSNPAWTH